MFSAITIRAKDLDNSDDPIDVGNLLECMLFYKSVYVVATPKMLRQLVRTFGLRYLQQLLESRALGILFSDEVLGIHTDAKNQIHSPILLSMAKYAPQYSLQEELRSLAIKLTGKEGQGRRAAQRLEKLIPTFKYDDGFRNNIHPLLANQSLIETTVKTILQQLTPEYTGEISFATEQVEKGFVVHTNLDFDALNELYHKRVSPSHSSLSPALMLSYACVGESHLYFAARQLSELSVDPLGAELVEARIVHLAKRSEKSELERQLFAQLILSEAKAVREAFNKGKVSIAEVVPVILAAGRFKDWLVKQDVDANIIREYYKEISQSTFIDKLPGKSTRWATFTGLGMLADSILPTGIGTATGVTMSILDSFFLEKIAKGWKPNQFVDEHLIPLLKKTEGK